jgi:hypothetical protein
VVCVPAMFAADGDLCPLGASVDKCGEVDRCRVLVETGQAEHVVDQPAHALSFQRDVTHRLIDLRAAAAEPTVMMGWSRPTVL